MYIIIIIISSSSSSSILLLLLWQRVFENQDSRLGIKLIMIVAWQGQQKNFSEFQVGTKQLPLHHFLCQLF